MVLRRRRRRRRKRESAHSLVFPGRKREVKTGFGNQCWLAMHSHHPRRGKTPANASHLVTRILGFLGSLLECHGANRLSPAQLGPMLFSDSLVKPVLGTSAYHGNPVLPVPANGLHLLHLLHSWFPLFPGELGSRHSRLRCHLCVVR